MYVYIITVYISVCVYIAIAKQGEEKEASRQQSLLLSLMLGTVIVTCMFNSVDIVSICRIRIIRIRRGRGQTPAAKKSSPPVSSCRQTRCRHSSRLASQRHIS